MSRCANRKAALAQLDRLPLERFWAGRPETFRRSDASHSPPRGNTRRRGASMKIGVLFDGMSALGTTPDTLILESVEAVEDSIADWGHQHVRIPVNPDGRWVERMRRGNFDLAFNLCEGIDGVAAFEPMVISVLELFRIPYTGNNSTTAA